MYSHEIEQLMKARNYLLSCEEYMNMHNTSPQINHTKYTASTQEFESWTSDNYYFKYKVYRKDKL